MQLALDGRLDVEPFVSRTLPLDEVNHAFELLEAQDGIRTVLTSAEPLEHLDGEPFQRGDVSRRIDVDDEVRDAHTGQFGEYVPADVSGDGERRGAQDRVVVAPLLFAM